MYMSYSDMTNAWFDVMCNTGIARIMHMSYRSKTCTWNDVILVKRSMIWVLLIRNDTINRSTQLLSQFVASGYFSRNSLQYCEVSSLTSQFTPDIVAIYTDGLTVQRHTKHCDGQWLIVDNYYRVSFRLLCHVVCMRPINVQLPYRE